MPNIRVFLTACNRWEHRGIGTYGVDSYVSNSGAVYEFEYDAPTNIYVIIAVFLAAGSSMSYYALKEIDASQHENLEIL